MTFPHPTVNILSRRTLLLVLQKKQKVNFTAISMPFAGTSFGIPWWKAVTHNTSLPTILDCGASTALALEALDAGITGVVCRNFHASIPTPLQHRLFTERPHSITAESFIHDYAKSQQSVTSY